MSAAQGRRVSSAHTCAQCVRGVSAVLGSERCMCAHGRLQRAGRACATLAHGVHTWFPVCMLVAAHACAWLVLRVSGWCSACKCMMQCARVHGRCGACIGMVGAVHVCAQLAQCRHGWRRACLVAMCACACLLLCMCVHGLCSAHSLLAVCVRSSAACACASSAQHMHAARAAHGQGRMVLGLAAPRRPHSVPFCQCGAACGASTGSSGRRSAPASAMLATAVLSAVVSGGCP